MMARRGREMIGRILRGLRVAGIVASVAAFLVYVYADNIIGWQMERSVRAELSAEGLSRSVMRPTPIEGFALTATLPLAGEFYGSALTHDGSGVWLADGTGAIVLFDLQSHRNVQRLEYEGFERPEGVFVTADERLLISDPGAGHVYSWDQEGRVERIDAPSNVSAFIPTRAVLGSDGMLYVLNQGYPPGILSLPSGKPAVTVYGQDQLYDLQVSGVHLVTAGVQASGFPLAKVSSVGVDVFANVDPERMWALPYWNEPFVAVGIEPDGFITIADRAGHLVQLNSSPRVILHLPAIPDAPGELRSLTVDREGNVIAIHEAGVRLYELTPAGAQVREATRLFMAGQYEASIPLWESLVAEAPDRSVLRQALAQAYLATGEPLKALPHSYLIADDEGFAAGVKAESSRVRRTYLWPIWTTILLFTVVVWILNSVWPVLTRSNRRLD